jgi:arginyl-tRNA synthetase
VAAATRRLLRAAGAGISAGPGPGVVSIRVPGPPPALAVWPGPDAPLGTLGELVAAVGAETASYALVSWPPGVPVVIDLGVWARRTRQSPAWAVRHAAERIGRIPAADGDGFDAGLLDASQETALLGLLSEFPAVVAVAGRAGEPHRVARYLENVARAWEDCAIACPVTSRRDEELARARTVLARAAAVVLGNGLRLLGVPG